MLWLDKGESDLLHTEKEYIALIKYLSWCKETQPDVILSYPNWFIDNLNVTYLQHCF